MSQIAKFQKLKENLLYYEDENLSNDNILIFELFLSFFQLIITEIAKTNKKKQQFLLCFFSRCR